MLTTKSSNFYMHQCDIVESEDDKMNRFFGGLNHDIRARFQYIPHCITGMYVRACTFERQIQEDALDDYNNYYSSNDVTSKNSKFWNVRINR